MNNQTVLAQILWKMPTKIRKRFFWKILMLSPAFGRLKIFKSPRRFFSKIRQNGFLFEKYNSYAAAGLRPPSDLKADKKGRCNAWWPLLILLTFSTLVVLSSLLALLYSTLIMAHKTTWNLHTNPPQKLIFGMQNNWVFRMTHWE